jgi:hypothetical protein
VKNLSILSHSSVTPGNRTITIQAFRPLHANTFSSSNRLPGGTADCCSREPRSVHPHEINGGSLTNDSFTAHSGGGIPTEHLSGSNYIGGRSDDSQASSRQQCNLDIPDDWDFDDDVLDRIDEVRVELSDSTQLLLVRDAHKPPFLALNIGFRCHGSDSETTSFAYVYSGRILRCSCQRLKSARRPN